MTLRLTWIMLALLLAGCSSTQMKAFGGHVASSMVGLALDVLGNDSSDDLAWVPPNSRCDNLCKTQRQAASDRLVESYERRTDRERKARIEAEFDAFMEELDAAETLSQDAPPVVWLRPGLPQKPGLCHQPRQRCLYSFKNRTNASAWSTFNISDIPAW